MQLYIARIEQQNKDLLIIKDKYNDLLLTKQNTSYNDIEEPTMWLKELETSLKLSDKYTLKIISEYLKLDSYEIVKNMAKVMNNWNAWEIIAYRDWALQRNQSLKELFQKIIKESEKPMHDKIKGKQL